MSHVLVVGSGVAGLTAALEAARYGPVTVVTKSALSESNTWYAQGGVAVVTGSDDSVQAHVADTLAAGAGLGDPEAVEVLCSAGPEVIGQMIERGVRFDHTDGQLARGLEAAHSRPRILHAGGDATGAGIAAALIAQVRSADIRIVEDAMVTDLLIEDGRVRGARLLDGAVLEADAVVLATGGAGQLYPHTTNPAVATGDGLALALRAGAVVADLEFYQFHPTALAVPDGFLISEAVRGEGAVLIDDEGKRFMFDLHPDGELAPRDVVARGIAARSADQGGLAVRLDATALGARFLAERFPTIDAGVRRHGFDWATQPLPVTPAAHYWMGGVRADAWGRTSLAGLYAVGEVACTGVHGANRLASNSLLEAAVYATRCVAAIRHDPPTTTWSDDWDEPTAFAVADGTVDFTRGELQALMWRAVGLSRDAAGLAEAHGRLARWRAPEPTDAARAEDANLLTVARATVIAAAARTESRGGHFRTDVPVTEPHARHSGLRQESL